MSIYHVIPTNDTYEHESEDTVCNCQPKVEVQEDGDILVIHNSFDGREAVEWAEEIINGKN